MAAQIKYHAANERAFLILFSCPLNSIQHLFIFHKNNNSLQPSGSIQHYYLFFFNFLGLDFFFLACGVVFMGKLLAALAPMPE
jgi:hypothetical protein